MTLEGGPFDGNFAKTEWLRKGKPVYVKTETGGQLFFDFNTWLVIEQGNILTQIISQEQGEELGENYPISNTLWSWTHLGIESLYKIAVTGNICFHFLKKVSGVLQPQKQNILKFFNFKYFFDL